MLHFFVIGPDQHLFRIPSTASLLNFITENALCPTSSANASELHPAMSCASGGRTLSSTKKVGCPQQFVDHLRESAFYKLIREKLDEKVVSIQERKGVTAHTLLIRSPAALELNAVHF